MLAFSQTNFLEPVHILYLISLNNVELPDTVMNTYQVQWTLHTNACIITVYILVPRAGRTGEHHLLLRVLP